MSALPPLRVVMSRRHNASLHPKLLEASRTIVALDYLVDSLCQGTRDWADVCVGSRNVQEELKASIAEAKATVARHEKAGRR